MKLRDFDSSLSLGRIGERLVSSHLMARGCGVVPSYEFSGAGGSKAPRLRFASFGLVIPDLDTCSPRGRFWVEVKSYRAPAFNRRHGAHVHGYSARLHRDYIRVGAASGSEVFLAVLEIESGELLVLDIAKHQAWPCMCGPCRDGREDACCIEPRAAVYFDRRLFRRLHVFGDGEMSEIRQAFGVS